MSKKSQKSFDLKNAGKNLKKQNSLRKSRNFSIADVSQSRRGK